MLYDDIDTPNDINWSKLHKKCVDIALLFPAFYEILTFPSIPSLEVGLD